ncbi:hypothetical protein FCR2A7T_04480 [Flavobacterium cauense R2A-7]|nr:hypothetical protein FCR2A7T_04480 [Flavobacterium cauense R2A-7]
MFLLTNVFFFVEQAIKKAKNPMPNKYFIIVFFKVKRFIPLTFKIVL